METDAASALVRFEPHPATRTLSLREMLGDNRAPNATLWQVVGGGRFEGEDDGVSQTQHIPRRHQTHCYRRGGLVDQDFALDELSEHLADEAAVVWVNLAADDSAGLQLVAEELGLHSLAVDDATSGRERPTFIRYSGHDFLTAYAVKLDPATGGLTTVVVSAFITPRALVTVTKGDSFPMDDVVRRWGENVELTAYGVGALVHGLVDYLVDSLFDAVQALDDQIEDLEGLLFDDQPQEADVQRRSFELRKSLVHVRRVVLPMRDVVNSMLRRDVSLVTTELGPYYQDVYDHVLRVTEWTESLRDLVSTIVETNLTIQGNRLNVITKQVTSWAAIIAVPTAITGFYGQNLPFPGFAQLSGFVSSSLLIVILSFTLYLVFRRKGWL